MSFSENYLRHFYAVCFYILKIISWIKNSIYSSSEKRDLKRKRKKTEKI